MTTMSRWEYLDYGIAFHFCGAALALVLGLGQFIERDRSPARLCAGALFCLLAVPQWNLGLEYAGLYTYAPRVAYLQMPLYSFIGPLVYLYFRQIMEPGFAWRPRLLWHLLPCVLAYLAFVPVLMLDDAEISRVWAGRSSYAALVDGVLVAVNLYTLVYLLRALREIVELVREYPRPLPSVYRLTLAFAALGTIILVLIAWNQVRRTPVALRTGFGLLAAMPVLLWWAGLRFPDYRGEMRRAAAQARYERSRLSGVNTDEVITRLVELMEIEHLYADEDLDLTRLAQALEITPHQLSEILNARLKQSFKNFVNGHRVAAAGRLLLAEPERSIASISAAVGFNSKSSFNAEFARLTGSSPSQFRRQGGPGV